MKKKLIFLSFHCERRKFMIRIRYFIIIHAWYGKKKKTERPRERFFLLFIVIQENFLILEYWFERISQTLCLIISLK